jgi:hypothetical protein
MMVIILARNNQNYSSIAPTPQGGFWSHGAQKFWFSTLTSILGPLFQSFYFLSNVCMTQHLPFFFLSFYFFVYAIYFLTKFIKEGSSERVDLISIVKHGFILIFHTCMLHTLMVFTLLSIHSYLSSPLSLVPFLFLESPLFCFHVLLSLVFRFHIWENTCTTSLFELALFCLTT